MNPPNFTNFCKIYNIKFISIFNASKNYFQAIILVLQKTMLTFLDQYNCFSSLYPEIDHPETLD